MNNRLASQLKNELERLKARFGFVEQSWKRWVYLSLFIISGVIIVFVLSKNWSELSELTSEVNYSLILIPVLLYPIGMLPTALSWHLVLESLGVKKPIWFNLRAFSLSTLPRKIPGSIWFLSSRASIYREVEISASTSIPATIIETLLLSLTGIGLSILLAGQYLQSLIHEYPNLAIAIPGFAVLFILILLLFSSPGGDLRRLVGGKLRLSFPQIQPVRLIGIISMMSIAWIGGGALLFITIQAVQPIPFEKFFTIVGIWALSGSISLVISLGVSAFGIREITLSALLGSLLISPISSIIVVIAFRIILTSGDLIWALIFITIANWRLNSREKTKVEKS